MSDMSDISTQNEATKKSPTEKIMMLGVTEKTATSSSFSERMKNTLGNFLRFTMGTCTGDEVETQEEEEDYGEQDDFGSQLSLNSSTHENGIPTNRETGSSDQFGVVRTINKAIEGSEQPREFVTMTNSEMRPGNIRDTGPSNPPTEPEADHEEASRQRGTTRVSTSTKLSGTNRVTPPLVTPLVDERASIEDFMRRSFANIGSRCFFCNLEGHFKSDFQRLWEAVAVIKHPRHEEALLGVKASKARLLSDVEARRKKKPQEATKKLQAVTEKNA